MKKKSCKCYCSCTACSLLNSEFGDAAELLLHNKQMNVLELTYQEISTVFR